MTAQIQTPVATLFDDIDDFSTLDGIPLQDDIDAEIDSVVDDACPFTLDDPAGDSGPHGHTAEEVVTTCPFTVVVDSNEGAPFRFSHLRTTALRRSDPLTLCRGKFDGVPLIVPTVQKAMWSMGRAEHGAGLGDYSIDGMEERVQIETKHSLDDLFLSCGSRRRNFEAEIASLNDRCEFAAVVVCGTWSTVQRYRPAVDDGRGMSPFAVRKTVLSWGMKYPGVHWFFLPTRDECERVTFEMLEMFWRKDQDAKRAAKRKAAKELKQREQKGTAK